MIKQSLYCIFLVVLFSSCISHNKNVKGKPVNVTTGLHYHDTVITIKIEPEMGLLDLTDKITNVKYIPLETTRESVIGEISKVILHKGNFYIMDDNITKTVFVFDGNGKFITKICRRGRGPGEYNDLWDFDIDTENDQILLYCGPRKMIRTTLAGELVSEHRASFYGHSIASMPNKGYAAYLYFSNNTSFQINEHSLIYLDSLGNIVKGMFPYDHSKFGKYSNVWQASIFYTYQNKKYLYPSTKDTVYRLSPDGLTPVYRFDFGKYSIDKTIFSKPVEEQDRFFKGNTKYARLFFMTETDHVLHFHVAVNGIIHRVYYSKSTGEVISGPMVHYLGVSDLGVPIASSGNTLIDLLDCEMMIHAKDGIDNLQTTNSAYLEVVKNFKEDDNPVLMTYETSM